MTRPFSSPLFERMLHLAPLLYRRSASIAVLGSLPRQSPAAQEVERELAANHTRFSFWSTFPLQLLMAGGAMYVEVFK